MQSEEPEPELKQLTECVEHLEERMSQFEQQLRSLPEPPAEGQDTGTAAATPDTGEKAAQEADGQDRPGTQKPVRPVPNRLYGAS